MARLGAARTMLAFNVWVCLAVMSFGTASADVRDQPAACAIDALQMVSASLSETLAADEADTGRPAILLARSCPPSHPKYCYGSCISQFANCCYGGGGAYCPPRQHCCGNGCCAPGLQCIGGYRCE